VSSNYIANRTFSITDLTRNDDRIVGKTFENCTIWGPAALAPDGVGVIDGCTFDGPRELVVWSVSENQQRAIGVIGSEDCVFRNCYFRRIGIVGGLGLRQKFERDEAKRNKESETSETSVAATSSNSFRFRVRRGLTKRILIWTLHS
jgi:hypothetical protein